jgi:hypothetical protein
MEKKYILNYIGGCKGDFLCNFLNNRSIEFKSNLTRLSSTTQNFKWLYHQDFNHELFQNFASPDLKIYPAHCSYKIPTDILQNNNLNIINLKFTKEIANNIKIEHLVKTFCQEIDDEMISQFKYFEHLNNIPQEIVNKIKFFIDIHLLKYNFELNDDNRMRLLYAVLGDDTNTYYNEFVTDDRSNSDEDLDYETLYIKKDFTTLSKMFEFDSQNLTEFINQTWLPEEIIIWGEKFDLSFFGYTRFL